TAPTSHDQPGWTGPDFAVIISLYTRSGGVIMTPIHQRLIDSTLMIVNARALELVVWTKFPVKEEAQHEERMRDRLRQSKLGYDLADLANYAEGEERVSTERARQAINDVSKVLFRQLYTSSRIPPVDFYKSDLGQLFNEVYLR